MSEKWETVGNGKAKPAANGKAKVKWNQKFQEGDQGLHNGRGVTC